MFAYLSLVKPRDPEKEDALVGATLRLADREGLEALTVQKVAREAGLAVGTVYVYFEGKEDLLRRVYVKTKRAAGEKLLSGVAAELTFKAAFRLLCQNEFDFLVEHRLEVGFQAKFFRSAFADAQTLALTRSYFDPIEALLLKAQHDGLIKSWPPAQVLGFVLTILKEAANQAAQLDLEGRALVSERATEFCLDGISL